MSPNIGLVRDLYGALNKGDLEQVRDQFLQEQATLHIPGRHAFSRRHQGRKNVLDFFSGVRQVAGEVVIEPETIAESGDQVLALVRVHAQRVGKPALETQDVHVFTIKGGKIAQIRSFPGDQYAIDDFLA